MLLPKRKSKKPTKKDHKEKEKKKGKANFNLLNEFLSNIQNQI